MRIHRFEKANFSLDQSQCMVSKLMNVIVAFKRNKDTKKKILRR